MTDIDFKSIVINGYFNSYHRSDLESYFKREIKKAEENYYSKKEFINGCNIALNYLQAPINDYLKERRRELLLMIESRKIDGKSYEDLSEEINALGINSYSHTILFGVEKTPLTIDSDFLLTTRYALRQLKHSENRSNENDTQFSALEWATIFYYVDSLNLLNGNSIKDKIENFKKKHEIEKSSKSLYNDFIRARKSINEIQDYPIYKLDRILPFLSENYNQAVARLLNDKEILNNNIIDNQ